MSARARAVMDLRLWIQGASELDVWRLATDFQERAKAVAPDGVNVRYVQLRDGEKTRGPFEATMGRKRRRTKGGGTRA